MKLLSCFLLCSFFLGACRERDASTPEYSPLPDHALGPRGEERQRWLIDGARKFCWRGVQGEESYIERSPDNLLGRAQCRVALHYLDRPETLPSAPPVVLFTSWGRIVGGSTAFSLRAINPNRETNKVHLLMRGPDQAIIRMLVWYDLETKELEYVSPQFFRTEIVEWIALKARASKAGGVIRVQAIFGDTIIFPDISVVSVCAAVEDRSGRISSFMPIQRLDHSLPRASAEIGNDDEEVPENGEALP